MNYIELNGVSSRDVQGLIIQSLAPITKPKMRTTVEEIDGRDGDIVTRLGYSAYDKEISIGLSWNYDIDEVIQYFVDNDKGTVLFSNEEDKLYKYEILDQIDFEKLIRFKTATVKFHVQPFKYSSIETVKTWHKDSGSITGTTNVIDSTENERITNLVLYGCTQKLINDTPTTSKMVDLVSLGENGTINLYNSVTSNGDSTTEKKYSIPIDEPLRNLYFDNGIHEDMQDIFTSNRKIVRKVGKYTFTGNENWASDDNNGYAYLMLTSVDGLSNVKPHGKIYSNHFNFGSSGAKGTIFVGDTAIAINYDDTVTNLTQLKAFLKNHHVYCLFELNNAITQELTQAQKNAINSIKLENGINELYLCSVNGAQPTFKTEYSTTDGIYVINSGNYFSRPTITIHGKGKMALYINGPQILVIDLGEETQITIDSEKMEAYNKDTSVLMNRHVSGNYENIKLNVGKNVIAVVGSNVIDVEISNFSRWI